MDTSLIPPVASARRMGPRPARPPRGRSRSAQWGVAVSLLLHAGVLALLLLLPRRAPEEGGQPPGYELMFEGGPAAPSPAPGQPPESTQAAPADAPAEPNAPPPAPPPAPVQDALPGPTSVPTELPSPDAPILPPEPEALPPVAPVPPSVQPMPPEPAAPAPPVPTPEPIPPQPSDLPAVRFELPLPVPPVPQPRPAPRVLPAAGPAPRPGPPAGPPAVPRPRSAPPPGTFGNQLDLSFNSPPSRAPASRALAPRGSVASRSFDLSPGAPRGPNRSDVFFDARAGKLGADWREGLLSYWLSHRFYPRDAAEQGEDGSVDIELTVNGSGRVQSAVLKSRSGSTFIDMAAIGTWRNAQLRPLPPELGDRYTFTITLNYILLR